MTALDRPGWATERSEEDASIRWALSREVDALPTFADSSPEPISVEVYTYDRLKVDGGAVRLERDEPSMIVAGQLMTVDQARSLAETISEVVKAVEA